MLSSSSPALFLQASQKYAGIPFDSNVVDMGIFLSQLHDKAPFSHSYLYFDGMVISEYLVPASFVEGRFLDHIGT